MISSHTSIPTTLLCLLAALFDPISARPLRRNTFPLEIRAASTNLSAYAPVLTDGTASLPNPTGTLTYIALGRGTQNYTCASATGTPSLLGATATLFDATQSLSSFPVSQGQAYLNTLPNNRVDNSVTQIKSSGLPVIGEHFFTAAGVPAWDLSSSDALLYGTSVADIPAPSGANAGPQGYGAVDWKALTAVAGSVGLEVYRVETAGGKAPASCSGVGVGETVLVQYAAMYWFYE